MVVVSDPVTTTVIVLLPRDTECAPAPDAVDVSSVGVATTVTDVVVLDKVIEAPLVTDWPFMVKVCRDVSINGTPNV